MLTMKERVLLTSFTIVMFRDHICTAAHDVGVEAWTEEMNQFNATRCRYCT